MEKDIFYGLNGAAIFWRRDLIEKLTSSSDFLLIFKLKERAKKMNFPILPERHTSALKLSFKPCSSWFYRRTSFAKTSVQQISRENKLLASWHVNFRKSSTSTHFCLALCCSGMLATIFKTILFHYWKKLIDLVK